MTIPVQNPNTKGKKILKSQIIQLYVHVQIHSKKLPLPKVYNLFLGPRKLLT